MNFLICFRHINHIVRNKKGSVAGGDYACNKIVFYHINTIICMYYEIILVVSIGFSATHDYTHNMLT